MIGSHHRSIGGARGLRRQIRPGPAACLALLVLAGTSISAAALDRGEGAESFAASFEARVVRGPTIVSCSALGPEGQKIEARYNGLFVIEGDERQLPFRLSLEILVDRSTGLGTAQGHWQLTDPSSEIVARGELVAVVKMVDPPDPDFELHGLLTGDVDPPDPDMPIQRLLGNFTASLGDGATFPHLKGTVGEPVGVADPTEGELLPAILVASDGC